MLRIAVPHVWLSNGLALILYRLRLPLAPKQGKRKQKLRLEFAIASASTCPHGTFPHILMARTS